MGATVSLVRRLLWLIGPLATSALLLGASLVLSGRFDLGLPLARGVPADLPALLSLSVTLLVSGAWLLGARLSRRDER